MQENKRAGNFDDYLKEALKDTELAAEYLNAALADGDPCILQKVACDIGEALDSKAHLVVLGDRKI